MHLVASVRLLSVKRKTKESHYQSKVFVCVYAIHGHMRLIVIFSLVSQVYIPKRFTLMIGTSSSQCVHQTLCHLLMHTQVHQKLQN